MCPERHFQSVSAYIDLTLDLASLHVSAADDAALPRSLPCPHRARRRDKVASFETLAHQRAKLLGVSFVGAPREPPPWIERSPTARDEISRGCHDGAIAGDEPAGRLDQLWGY